MLARTTKVTLPTSESTFKLPDNWQAKKKTLWVVLNFYKADSHILRSRLKTRMPLSFVLSPTAHLTGTASTTSLSRSTIWRKKPTKESNKRRRWQTLSSKEISSKSKADVPSKCLRHSFAPLLTESDFPARWKYTRMVFAISLWARRKSVCRLQFSHSVIWFILSSRYFVL